MGYNLVQKIIASHLQRGVMEKGSEIVVSVDQTLSHDLTSIIIGQMLDAVGVDKVRAPQAVFYCDHNVLCTMSENSDDHYFIRTCAARFGAYYSRPGNGICHFVHCERFAAPGKVVIGADSHTPMSGALGALAIGSGGFTVAKAAIGEGFRFKMPSVIGVELTGRLSPGVSAKDVALELLRIFTVKGAVGSVFEYFGEGVSTLSMAERMTIANMSLECGATSGVFGSDEITREFLEAQERAGDYIPLSPDADAEYDRVVKVDLSALAPLAACPESPDNVRPVAELSDVKPSSVFIGSCTNASYLDIARAAAIMEGRRVDSSVDCTVGPGSRQVYHQLLEDGVMETLMKAGCRILECACGPCIGIGQVPRHNGITVRTSNRNFPGRTGSNDAVSYLVGPETAAATAVAGRIALAAEFVSPEKLEAVSAAPLRQADDNMLIAPLPEEERKKVQIVRGPGISALPSRGPIRETIDAAVSIRLGDNVTTDDIIPGGSAILKYIADIPKFAEYTFCYADPSFVSRAKGMGHSVIIGGENYGQGSSREHAAMLPMFLGVEAVIARSYARIHKENLFNYGIIPLQFTGGEGFDLPQLGDKLVIENVKESIAAGEFVIRLPDKGVSFRARLEASEDDKRLLLAGGAMNYLSERI